MSYDDEEKLPKLDQALSGHVNDYLLYEILGGIDPSDTSPYVDRARSYLDRGNVPDPDDSGAQVAALAARCELGFLTGKGIPTFVHVEPDVEGRNYLWAQIKPYPHMVRCATLVKATEEAIAYLSGHG